MAVLTPGVASLAAMDVSFYDFSLATAPGAVFTPRHTTERLVDAALERLRPGPARVADVGTGAGAVAVAIALHRPCVEVFATDSNPAAVALARENARRHGVSDRVHVVHGDLLAGVPARLDLVVANLPYLPPCRAADFPTRAGDRGGVVGRRARPLPPPAGCRPRRCCGRERRYWCSSTARFATSSLPLARLDSAAWAASLREVVFVDGVRTAFGRAGAKGVFWRTRADDMAVKVVRELLRRNPSVPGERIGDVIMAATAQVGDQGLTLGRDVGLLAGLPNTVPASRSTACAPAR